MPEALPWLEHVDDHVGVDELHDAAADDVQRVGRLAILDEDRHSRVVGPLGRRGRDLAQLGVLEPVERLAPREELRDTLACGQGSVTR